MNGKSIMLVYVPESRNRDKFLFVQSIIGVNVARNGDKLGMIFQDFEKSLKNYERISIFKHVFYLFQVCDQLDQNRSESKGYDPP